MKLVVLLLVVVGCAKTAHDLSPFPCATDLTCPSGLACVGGQCQAAQIDAICTVGDDPTDCGPAAPGARCSNQSTDVLDIGACELPCSGGCAAGRVCSATDNNGFCLVDCNSDASICPANTVCLPRDDGKKVCMPPAIGCRTVSNVKRCTARFCEERSTAVDCPDGIATCPEDSTCSSNSRSCTCEEDHEAIACDDTPCNNACGGQRHWWCAPILSASCGGDLTDIQLTCECWKGSIAVDCDQAGRTCEELCRDL